ncbi:MAG: PEP-CTERM sorting domain-containing protein [Gemmatimonadaceae bacterium]
MSSGVMRRGAVALCAIALVAPAAVAQGWVHLPNGQLGYVTDNTTTGFFTCGNPFFILGSCSASGNTMTLGSGGSAVTFTFQGVAQTITASAGKSTQVNVGRITKSFAGSGPHVFPASKNISAPLFFFSIIFNTSFPIAGSGIWRGGYRATSPTGIRANCCTGGQTAVGLPVTTPPAHYRYNQLIYYGFPSTTITVGPEEIDVFAKVAVIPEPATIWLTGSGLVGLYAFRRRRRRR